MTTSGSPVGHALWYYCTITLVRKKARKRLRMGRTYFQSPTVRASSSHVTDVTSGDFPWRHFRSGMRNGQFLWIPCKCDLSCALILVTLYVYITTIYAYIAPIYAYMLIIYAYIYAYVILYAYIIAPMTWTATHSYYYWDTDSLNTHRFHLQKWNKIVWSQRSIYVWAQSDISLSNYPRILFRLDMSSIWAQLKQHLW